MVDVGINGAVGIVGIVIGWWLNDRSNRSQERREVKREVANARQVVRREIDHNLTLLHGLWIDFAQTELPTSILEYQPGPYRLRVAAQFRAGRLATSTIPIWRCHAWHAQATVLATALSAVEAAKINEIYSQLDLVADIHAKLDELCSEQPRHVTLDIPGSRPIHQIEYPQQFDQRAPALWAQCERIVNELFSAGNPLAIQP